MKKIFKIISLVMMMVMCFSVTAFAAETDETSNYISCHTGAYEDRQIN